MKITFPHMGNTYIVIKTLFDTLGVNYVIPPFVNKRALEIGMKYGPELACLPLKINLGNYIEAIEMGADTIVMIGGYGPCRLGYYGEIQREILREIGYDVDVIVLEMLDGADLKVFLKKLSKLSNNSSLLKILKAIRWAVQVAVEVDNLERLTFKTRPREKVRGTTDKIYSEFREKAVQVKGVREIRTLIKDTYQKLQEIKMAQEFRPLKIGIIGEIYTVIEPFVNFGLERKLGYMGVEIDRSVMVGDWIIEHIVKKALFLKRKEDFKKAARPYLETYIGGHALESVGHSVLYSKGGYDGVIQVYPLTCMPEIVAESILPSVSRDYDLPILTLIVDEMTGEAGIQTRLEAFVDLLRQRKEQVGAYEKREVLSWN